MSVMQAEIGQSSDVELVAAARAGQSDAFGALAHRYFGMVYAIGLARLGNRDLAEDLAQEVLLRAFLLLDQLDSQALFSHWVSRIARNLAIDWQRRGDTASRLIPMVPLDEITREVADDKAADPRTEAATVEQSVALREALGRLSPEAREVVLMHYMEGISQHEIARRMGVNHTTVARQIGRSLVAMRVVMESTVRNMARGLAARPSAKSRTAALGAAVIALPAATRSSLAAIAAQSLQSGGSASSAKAAGAAIGWFPAFIKTSLSLLKTGGAVMGYGKVVAGVAIVAALAGGGYYYFDDEGSAPPSKPAIGGEPIVSSDPVVFKMSLPPGKRIVMRTETASDSVFEMPKDLLTQLKAANSKATSMIPKESKTHIIEDMAITAHDEEPDGGRAVDFETVGVSMMMNVGDVNMTGAAGTLQSNPASGASSTAADKKLDLSKQIGKKVVGHLNAQGDVVSVDGLEDQFAALKKGLPASNPMSSFMATANSEAAWKQKYQSFFGPKSYSSTPVNPGESWKSRTLPGGSSLGSVEGTCRFTGWKMLDGRRVAEVAFNDDPNEKPASDSTLPFTMKYDSIAQGGTVLFDTEYGILAQMSTHRKTDLSTDLPIPGKTGLKMKLHMEVTTNISQVKPENPTKVVAAGT